MAVRRLIKKSLYVAGFLVCVLGAMFLIAYAVVSPRFVKAPVVSPTPSFQAVIVEQVDVIPHVPPSGFDKTTVDIVARLRNPNPAVGVATFPVTFIVKNSQGVAVARTQTTTFLLPGSLQYATAINVALEQGQLGTVEVQLPPTPMFEPLPTGISLPEFNLFLRDRTIEGAGTSAIERQNGVISNTGAFEWEKVEITAVALSADNHAVGVGQTFVGALKNAEQRDFSVNWPQPTAATVRVIGFASTNVFSPTNRIQVIGDPNQLR